MRILLGAHAFPPASTAGVEVYTLRVARELQRLGHDVLVLSAVHDLGARPYAVRRRRHEGVDVAEVVNVHHLGTLESTYDDAGVDASAATVLREFQPDVVHLQHLLNLSVGVIRDAKRAGAAVLLTLHDYWLGCPRDGLRMRADLKLCESIDHATCAECLADSPYLVPALQRGLSGTARRAGLGRHLHRLHAAAPRITAAGLAALRRLSPAAPGLATAMDRRAAAIRAALAELDLILAPTAFARDRALEFGAPAARLRVWPLGALTAPPRARPAGPRRRFGFVGTLAPHKGVHVLVEAFRGLTVPGVSLELHGSPLVFPAYAGELRRAASGDDRIRFRGAFPDGEQPSVLAGLDVLVLPSVWWENSPLSVIESLAAGVAVVASRTGGVPEIVPEGAGLLVPPGDVGELRRALGDVAEGRALAGAAPALSLKTAGQEAQDLSALYARLARPALEVARA